MTSSNDSIDYYNTHAQQFIESSVNADMSALYDRFTKYLPEQGSIFDVGCGSGRDSLYFITKGYEVTSLDAAQEMCRAAEKLTGRPVIHMGVEDITFRKEFDGIWACASLLHIQRDQMKTVLEILLEALKDKGALYASWKLGVAECWRSGGVHAAI